MLVYLRVSYGILSGALSGNQTWLNNLLFIDVFSSGKHLQRGCHPFATFDSRRVYNVPAGKRLHNYGKIHHFRWVNPRNKWSFSIAMLVITRGYYSQQEKYGAFQNSLNGIEHQHGMIVEVVQGRTLLRFPGEGVAGWDTLGSAGLRCGAVFQPDFSGKTRNRQLLLLPEIVISTPTSHTYIMFL
jgi:hypothetical protein